MVICDMSVGSIEITLPANSVFGCIVKRDGASNTLTVNPGTGRTINGEATLEILYDQSGVRLSFDGTSNWEIT